MFFAVPPVVCYLDRDVGAAIRRARTRMPGGGSNPVAIIHIPRERMVGTGVASSLMHEVGHQAAALLDLEQVPAADVARPAARYRVGGNPAGSFGNGGSPRSPPISGRSPESASPRPSALSASSACRAHSSSAQRQRPAPVPLDSRQLSGAIGAALYPDPQWRQLSATWEAFYPPSGLGQETQALLEALQASMPAFVAVLINHRPKALRGRCSRRRWRRRRASPRGSPRSINTGTRSRGSRLINLRSNGRRARAQLAKHGDGQFARRREADRNSRDNDPCHRQDSGVDPRRQTHRRR